VSTLPTPCLTCGRPTRNGSRCEVHTKGWPAQTRSPAERGLGADHRRIAKQVLAEESRCWICGRLPTRSDPLVADHVVPRSRGGQNVRSNYHAAHASCNRKRGNAYGGAGS
jgi:5-methylcytosine-specific restriction endonuclease McrA